MHTRPSFNIKHALQGTAVSIRFRFRVQAAQATPQDDAWALLRKATQLDARGQLMGSPLVSTADARHCLRNAVEVCVGMVLVCFANTDPQAAATTANPAVAWDPSAPNLLISVLASDVRLALRALRDYCDGMGVPQPTTVVPRVADMMHNHSPWCMHARHRFQVRNWQPWSGASTSSSTSPVGSAMLTCTGGGMHEMLGHRGCTTCHVMTQGSRCAAAVWSGAGWALATWAV